MIKLRVLKLIRWPESNKMSTSFVNLKFNLKHKTGKNYLLQCGRSRYPKDGERTSVLTFNVITCYQRHNENFFWSFIFLLHFDLFDTASLFLLTEKCSLHCLKLIWNVLWIGALDLNTYFYDPELLSETKSTLGSSAIQGKNYFQHLGLWILVVIR